jgi:hypothetical protein
MQKASTLDTRGCYSLQTSAGGTMSSTRLSSSWISIIAMTTSGCMVSAASDAEPDRQNEAIIHGVLDEGDPAVVMLQNNGSGYCTGTLISKTVVVTAAHCLDFAPATSVGFGTYGDTTPVGVKEQHAHPLWDGLFYSGHDVAVLILASEVSGVTPVPVDLDPADAPVAAPLRILGFGHDTAPVNTGFGTKRQASVHAADETDEFFLEVNEADGTQACFGDSGGPALFTGKDGVERVAGVTSFGGENCVGGGFYTRLAKYADFLAQYVDAALPPVPEEPPADSISPTANLVSPSSGRIVLSGRRSIIFDAQDNVGVADVELNWLYNGKAISCAKPAAGWSCSQNGSRYTFTADIGAGTRTFTLEAHDAAGNSVLTPRYSVRFW